MDKDDYYLYIDFQESGTSPDVYAAITHENFKALLKNISEDTQLVHKIYLYNEARDILLYLGVKESPGIPKYFDHIFDMASIEPPKYKNFMYMRLAVAVHDEMKKTAGSD